MNSVQTMMSCIEYDRKKRRKKRLRSIIRTFDKKFKV